MKFTTKIILPFILFISLNYLNAQNSVPDTTLNKKVLDFTNNFLNGSSFKILTGYNKQDSTTIDTILVYSDDNIIQIFLDKHLAYAPFRENSIKAIIDSCRTYLPELYVNYNIKLYSDSILLTEYIPNVFRIKKSSIDNKRIPAKIKSKTKPIVTNNSKPYHISKGLNERNIALWHSHGWYYNAELNRWEWQRARLFQIVEDMGPMSYTLPYLVPMLENAGAYVFIPRERDWQTNEVIVDNNGSNNNSLYKENLNSVKTSSNNTGFAIGNPPYTNENPFKLGTYISFGSDKKGLQSVSWTPNIPEDGEYAVYISYKASAENVNDANYIVHHDGKITEFTVNQQIGGSTWIYLGKFKFKKGMNAKNASVVLTSKSKKANRIITADAVRFGGGMGVIARNGITSNKPKYQEGARYYLQYCGFPDSLVWNLKGEMYNDYKDDYKSRGEWVDYLMGAPSGPTKNRNVKGLGIPIDLSLAFHTDAGICGHDSIIGTLAIYSTKTDTSVFPNGLSKMASRDLSDIIQSQIVNDIRIKYDSNWTRRGLWDKDYSEAWRPMVPAMLLELYSHQNFMDARFNAEPQFRFDVSRAIYKGMLKFLSFQYNFKYVVQPLPVNHLKVLFDNDGNIKLSWQQQSDPLEQTAVAEKYVVYTRIDEGDFDNGQLVKNNSFTLKEYQKDKIYSFKVTAINKGGESFPSEILSICKLSNSENNEVLIINGFDRISAPAYVDQENFAGFADFIDEGIPYYYDIGTTGSQYDFNRNSPWLDDDSPGFGASYSDKESLIIPGNTFDFSYIHGLAIKNAGYSFVSVSDESVLNGSVKIDNYDVADYLAGEEKTSYYPKNESKKLFEVYPEGLLEIFDKYLKSGGSLFISGAYIGTDAKNNGLNNKVDSILKFKWRTNHASRMGQFYFTDTLFDARKNNHIFNSKYNPEIYKVEAADAIEPADSLGRTIIRYTENNMSAAVAYEGKYKIIAIGFPFETITSVNDRNLLMKKVLTRFMHSKTK